MKNSKLYYTLPTIKAVRRRLRRACQPFRMDKSVKRATFILMNESGEDMMKIRRWRNRLMTSDLKTLQTKQQPTRNNNGI